MPENNYSTTLKEQCSDSEPSEIKVNFLSENGQLWIQPKGYGEKCVMDGQGYPIGLEIWQGKLRLVLFDDINSEEAKIIDIDNSKESRRHEYCQAAEYLAEHGRKVFLGSMEGGIWNGACITASIMSHKQDDRAAYEYLLRIAEKYSVCLTDEQKQTLDEIKNKAAAFLKNSNPSSVNTNSQEQKISDRCNWCDEVIETEPKKWKGLLFCSESCLDACRVVN